ncbi:acyltransferase 3 [Fusarium venenatum]|nr:acyltransferase 3 [Fusarium venenatum]
MLPIARSRTSQSGTMGGQDLLPRSEYEDKPSSASAPNSRLNRDKIKCLDGLRGIACLLVFNYHFFWPWTPVIMLGYGAFPPRAPEPYWGWQSLPIICLLHRGRAMVAIFFAISGYVICRHILRLIHERKIDSAYQKLASSVFRRIFRLYIPPTISMFLVAVLAQIGVFKSEFSIYKGPDSHYINATITHADLAESNICVNGTAVKGAAGIANYLGIETTAYLRNTTGYPLGNTTEWTDQLLCVNHTTRSYGPSQLYTLESEYEAQFPANDTNITVIIKPTKHMSTMERLASLSYYDDEDLDLSLNATNATNPLNLTWVQMGGSWEEHPFIHPNLTYAMKNFTRSYAEWANPFNFGHYHTRYDPHTFTIPMEFRGSMLIYIFLLGTAFMKAKWRARIGSFLSVYSLIIGRWDMATFMGGMLLSEHDIRRSSDLPPSAAGAKGRGRDFQRTTRGTVLRWAGIILALYFLSYPDAGAEYTPGFAYLSTWVPRYYIPLSGWMFYQAMGAVLLVACILRSPALVRLLESRFPQYLGKVSFSLYLVHGPVLHSLGFWIMPRLFDSFGKMGGYAVGWVILMAVTFYLTNLWNNRVDVWSVTVGRRVEKMLAED